MTPKGNATVRDDVDALAIKTSSDRQLCAIMSGDEAPITRKAISIHERNANREVMHSGNEKKPATKTGLNLLFKESHPDHFVLQDRENVENSIHHTLKNLQQRQANNMPTTTFCNHLLQILKLARRSLYT